MAESERTERYARQIALPGFGEPAQALLEDARVLVIGGGGLGSTVIPILAGAGVGTLGIVDDDTVELSNLHRQTMHGTSDLGRKKTTSAADAVAESNPGTVVRQHPVRLSVSNALELFDDYDVVIDGSDNFPTRYLVSDAASILRIPLVWGAVSQYGGQASVAWGERGPTYRDLFPTPPPPGSVLSCEAGGVLPTAVSIVGSIMANEAIKIITGIGEVLIGRVSTFDALTGGFRELRYERDPHADAVTQLIDYDVFCGLPTGSRTIEASALARELAGPNPPLLLDVREEWEASISSLPGSVLKPLGGLEGSLDDVDRDRPVVVYCHHGVRSAAALELLNARGFTRARHLEGGIDSWAREIDQRMARY